MIDYAPYPALQQARRRSLETLARIEQALGSLDDAVVAASGSLGRLEACDQSDADLIVVAECEIRDIWQRLDDLGIRRPRPGGVFASPVSRQTLFDPARRGLVAEELPVFGKRIQLVLDARPVHGDAALLWRQVLDWYALDSRPDYLLADLGRYRRGVLIADLWDRRGGDAAWTLRQVKRAYSRHLMVVALMLLIAELGTAWQHRLVEFLPFTPLERLAWVYDARHDDNFGRIASAYEAFVSWRDQGGTPPSSCALHEELARFFLAHHKTWPSDVTPHMMF